MTTYDGAPFQDIFYTARDGLRLYGRKYLARTKAGQRRTPVVCLAGLTRNSRDFHDLAQVIAQDKTQDRTVYTVDYRGRGRSQFDTNWRNYSLQVEMHDVLDFLTLNDLHHSILLGTSRGGLLAMIMGAAQPTTIAGVILNDIGPVIETAGLTRIGGYVGRTPTPQSWEKAGAALKRHNKAHFSSVSDEQWIKIAKQWFNEKDGKPAQGYDPKLAQALAALKGAIPELWPQFDTLKRVPLLIIRGGNSDLLSEDTVARMLRRHPQASTYTVPDEGHAPLLQDAPTQNAILQFLASIDAS